MADSYTQDKRLGELRPIPGLDGLVLTRFVGTEGISELFEFNVEAVSKTEQSAKLGAAIGKDATVLIRSYGKERFFSGKLVHAAAIGFHDEGYLYRLTLRPWLYMLSKRFGSRIFHDKSVEDVLKAVATESIQFTLSRTYPQLEYVVQHRESDLDFMLRLMEAHGMSFHFKFADGSHQMIVTDKEREDMPGGGKRVYLAQPGDMYKTEEHIYSWQPHARFTTGKVRTNDYDLLKPTQSLVGEATSSPDFTPGNYTHYEQLYPQHLAKEVSKSYGDDFAQALLDRFRSEDQRIIAAGDAPGLTPGFKMTLTDAKPFDGEYLVVRASHTFQNEDYRTGGAAAYYDGAYELLPASQNFVPPLVTPRPRIHGVQTGVVVGKEGNIDVDEYGRILVELHWNRSGPPQTEPLTMRCRVMQSWAGQQWGTIFTPRNGMEVLVEFIDGDPDRPLVVGCVYNGDNKPPYDLPGGNNKNISGWKTRSTEGGGPDDFNEFVFDDTAGKEVVRLHAQKDLDVSVENDEKRLVERNRISEVKNDDTLKVTNNLVMQADNSITIKVGSNTIVLDQGGISINGLQVSITATAALSTEGKGTATHKAGGPMTIQGMPVKIN